MSKKTYPTPFFIIFANMDFVTPNLYKDGKITFTHQEWLKHIKAVVSKTKKQFPDHKNKFNMLLKSISASNVKDLLKDQSTIKGIIDHFILSDPDSISLTAKINKILKNIPIGLKRERGRFSLAPYRTGSFINELCFEIALFLTDGYKKNVFAKCALEECRKIILTTNGKRYCSDSHKQKVYDQKILADEKKAQERRQYDRLKHEYHRLTQVRGEKWLKKYPNTGAYIAAKMPTKK